MNSSDDMKVKEIVENLNGNVESFISEEKKEAKEPTMNNEDNDKKSSNTLSKNMLLMKDDDEVVVEMEEKEEVEESGEENFLSKIENLTKEQEETPAHTSESNIEPKDDEAVTEGKDTDKSYREHQKETEEDPVSFVLKRIELIENRLNQIKSRGNHKEGPSLVQIENMIDEKIKKSLEDIRTSIQEAEVIKESNKIDPADFKEEPKEEYEYAHEEEPEEHERQYAHEEEPVEYEYIDEDNFVPKTESKKNSILKTVLIAVAATFVLLVVLVAGYWYIAKDKKASTDNIKISHQPKQEKPTKAQSQKKNSAEASIPKASDYIDSSKLPRPSEAPSKPEAKMPMAIAEEEKSPIEQELFRSTKKKDIAFACRLKAKYPAGDYVYYNKDGSTYTPNMENDTVEILEKNVIYNYSPDGEFVKISEGKYLKSKIFTQCSSIKAR